MKNDKTYKGKKTTKTYLTKHKKQSIINYILWRW